MREKPEIIVYVTENRERVITGNPLSLHIADETERRQTVQEIGRALRANVIQLKNGDYMIVADV